jgi:alpha-D-ribose 1-methylphosphonate 5-triphosphate synthase subunit PhnG
VLDMTDDRRLSLLAAAEPAALKALADMLLQQLGDVEVIQSRTGLVMLPMRDTVTGTDFHLGEVLVAEAHVMCGGATGYGMVTGRDLEQAMAMALVDLAGGLGVGAAEIAALTRTTDRAQQAADDTILCRVAATRVEMETF